MSQVSLGKVKGDNGADGESPYQAAVKEGYNGTEAEFYAALVSLKDGPFLPLSGGTMEGVLAMGGNAISGVAAINGPPNSPIDIDEINLTSGFTTDGDITFNLNGCLVQGVNTPQSVTDAANKGYVDDLVGNINTVLDTINGEVI